MKVKEKPEGSGVYWLFICHKGKRKAKKLGKDRELALKVAKRLDAKLTLDQLGFATGTFADYAERWIQVDVPAKNKPSTIRNYTEILAQHVKPVFGSRPVGEITRAEVKEFLQKKVARLAPSTVKHFKSVISGVLCLAMDEGALKHNPARQLGKWTRERNINEDVNPLTREELRRLLEVIQVHYPAYHGFVLTLARTGMRLGEAKALQWGDIDFVNRCIRVERSFSMRTIGKPKSGKGRRCDMSRQLAMALQSRYHNVLPKKLTDWVFQNTAGSPLDVDKFRRLVFKPALVKAGLREIRVHDLRHTFASLLIEQGESLPYIRDQLGHHSIKITVDIYGHLQPGGNVGAVDKLDDAEKALPGAAHASGTQPDATIRNQEDELKLEEARLLH